MKTLSLLFILFSTLGFSQSKEILSRIEQIREEQDENYQEITAFLKKPVKTKLEAIAFYDELAWKSERFFSNEDYGTQFTESTLLTTEDKEKAQEIFDGQIDFIVGEINLRVLGLDKKFGMVFNDFEFDYNKANLSQYLYKIRLIGDAIKDLFNDKTRSSKEKKIECQDLVAEQKYYVEMMKIHETDVKNKVLLYELSETKKILKEIEELSQKIMNLK